MKCATWGRALSWRRQTPFVSRPLLRFWIARRSFFKVSQYHSAFIVTSEGMKSTSSTPVRSQKIVAMIFLADSICLNFCSFGEVECRHWRDFLLDSGVKWCTHVSIGWQPFAVRNLITAHISHLAAATIGSSTSDGCTRYSIPKPRRELRNRLFERGRMTQHGSSPTLSHKISLPR